MRVNACFQQFFVICLVLFFVISNQNIYSKNYKQVNLVDVLDQVNLSPYLCFITTASCPVEVLQVNDTFGLSVPERSEAGWSLDKTRPYLYAWTEGATLYQQGQEDLAIAVWQQNPEFNLYLFNLAWQTADPIERKRLLNLSIAVAPTADAYWRLGILLFREDQNDEAQTALLSALQLERSDSEVNAPKEANILAHLGNTYWRQQDLPQARLFYEEALHLDPNSVMAQNGLERVLQRETPDN